jgi:succinyl-CoA synthetase alpha subunit
MGILVSENTSVIIQGITGREGVSFSRTMLEYGAKVVAGVTPGRGGRTVNGVDVYNRVTEALEKHPADASIVSVPPAHARAAAIEALEAGLRLVMILTERVPLRDTLIILETARRYQARIIGPNTLGLIAPGVTKLGMAGGPLADTSRAYSPGPVGIASRSGGMMTEVADLLTRQGIGQSTCVNVGGDRVVGTNFLDLADLFDKDPQTKALVLFCEPGGSIEERLAERVGEGKIRTPIVAFVAGRFMDDMPGVRFGHAGSMVEGSRGTAAGKMEAMSRAGIRVAQSLSDIVPLLRECLGQNGGSK